MENNKNKKVNTGKSIPGGNIKDSRSRSSKHKKPNRDFNLYWIYAIIAIVFFGIQFFNWGTDPAEITWQKFEKEILSKHEVADIVIVNNEFVEIYIKQEFLKSEKYKDVSTKSVGNAVNPGPHYSFLIGSPEIFEKQLEKAQTGFSENDIISPRYEKRKNWGGELLGWLFPILLMIVLWMFIMRRVSGTIGTGMGSGAANIFNIGRSKAALFDAKNNVNISFKDVAGLEEAKEEVQEVVEFLKNPKKFTRLGAKIPKGVLLIGPPGTGKTLLAKAVAGEAHVPFFSLSGSDFVEMFVGVGAARVRDLFQQAKAKAPSIIFIDEIDAIGRSRSKATFTGANDERENTLNSLLSEMDGFTTNSGVIILGATNRPEILDYALLRPGRFDRQIAIDKPDLNCREAIFNVHLKPLKKLHKDVKARKLAEQTPGFAGAEIANVCNESTLIAARNNKKVVDMQDFQDAIDRVIGGLEKKNKIILPEEKEIVAYHEAGHAVAGWFLEHAHPLVKVSIVPRGIAALGYAQYLPKEQYLYRTEQLMDEMCMSLGGRAAEEIAFGKISTGALDDLERITKVAYSMVAMYGMNKKIGNISFYDKQQSEYTFTKPYSEATARIIDEEVSKLVESAFERTKNLLMEKRKELELIAKELLKKEVLFVTDLERLIGKRPYDKEIKSEGMPVAQEAPPRPSRQLAGKETPKDLRPSGQAQRSDTPAEKEGEPQADLSAGASTYDKSSVDKLAKAENAAKKVAKQVAGKKDNNGMETEQVKI